MRPLDVDPPPARFFPQPARPTGVYSLLNVLARYAYVYGRIDFGDFHGLSHFVEEHTPAVLVCRGEMSDLELALSLAAIGALIREIEDEPAQQGAHR